MLTSFLGWVLRTVTSAAEAEMDDDSVLREQLLEAEMRRETGEITDREFADIEADLLARIREIRARREGGAGPFTMSGPIEMADGGGVEVEASVTGDFHDPAAAPHTTIIDAAPGYEEHIEVLPPPPSAATRRSRATHRAAPTTRRSPTGSGSGDASGRRRSSLSAPRRTRRP